ncbi:MAG: DNA polymerase I [Erysipelotrichaceae bacterium]|nr:DNA polymerase I [Erysipelotrichaceae bacterium]
MKILLIDGNSVIFRAFYATSYTNMMQTSFGAYTNAVYAFANMLNKALGLIEPDYCVVAFDKGKHTFRHDLNPDYKGGRKPTPPELVEQFKTVRMMLDAYNIKYLEYDNIEADDIIGTLAKKYDMETCVFSSDHDLFQLIDDSTSVYCMKKGMSDIQKLDEKALMEEYGLLPKQIIDYKGLAGDKSDNIKGVEGVGDKTAVKLLQDYNSCEGIYENIDKIKGKLHDRLVQDKESCFLSKKLATIKTDVDIPDDLETFKLNINEETKNEFFEKYEMKSLVNRDFIKKQKKTEYKKVNKISSTLLKDALIYFDSDEFTYFDRKCYGICVCNEEGEEYISFEDAKNDKAFIDYIGSDNHKIVYDLKAVKHELDYNDIYIGTNTDDVYLMAYLANNTNSDLSTIIHNYGFYLDTELKDIYGTEKKPLEIDESKQISRAFELTSILFNIYKKALKQLKDDDIYDLYQKVELPLVYVLHDMEINGINCDEKELDTIADNTSKIISKLEKDIYKAVGHEFNINSPAQLKEVLYDELDLPDLKKGSTNAEVLQKIVDYDPVVEKILEYRKFSKLYSTYAEGLKKYICEDNKIHTIFSQTITATGRLSSYDPNLQNISVRDEDGREIRKAFKPSKGNVLISSDYSQIELRVLCSLANEKNMIDAFNNGVDIHDKTAMDIFGLKQEEVTPLIRRQAKAINFGVVYGISDFGLANQAGLSLKDSKKFIEDYFITYPNIKKYLDEQVEFCQKNGYVKTMLNRRRYIPEIKDSKWMIREFGKRAAMNATIQGSAADIIKIAMVNIYNRLEKEKLNSKLILQVHDELIFDVPKDEEELMKKLILEEMSSAYKMKCKLDSSLAVGKDWYEAK